MRNLSISARIIFGFALLLAFLLLSGLVSHLQMGRIQNKVADVASHDIAFFQSMSEVRYHMGNLRRFEKDAFINIDKADKRQEYFDKWQGSLGKARQALDGAAPSAPDSGAAGQLDKLKGLLGSYEQGYRSVQQSMEAGTVTTTADANKAMGAYKGSIHDLETLVGTLAEQAKSGAEGLAPQVSATVQAVDRLQLVLIVSAVLVGGALAIVIGASIRRPLRTLVAFSHEVADSRKLNQAPPQLGRNEIGEVAEAFGQLIVSMRELIEESHQHADALVNQADDLAQVSQRVAQASHDQAQAAAAGAAAIEEVTVSINVMAENAHGVQQQAHSASGEAKNGGQLASRTALDIRDIAASIKSAGELIEQLNQRSDEIGAIVQVIRDIAEQTNLLALNAAIEAARAGEQGRGFAVVADEVRKLAERTSQATGEISSRIAAVQGDTKAAFQSMQDATGRIENGVQGAQRVEESLQSIHTLSQQSVEKVSDMADAIKEQSHASQDLAQNMEQIAQMNDRTNQAVQQSYALANSLKQLSSELNSGLNRFEV